MCRVMLDQPPVDAGTLGEGGGAFRQARTDVLADESVVFGVGQAYVDTVRLKSVWKELGERVNVQDFGKDAGRVGMADSGHNFGALVGRS